MSLLIETAQRQAFRAIFDLKADKNGKLTKEGLQEIFKAVDYKCTEKQFYEFQQRLFNKKDTIEFNDFMKIFNLKMPDYSPTDVKNAFKLIAGSDDEKVSLHTLETMLEKNGMTEQEIKFLMLQLSSFIDTDGKFKYREFLKSLSLIKE